MQKIIVSLMAAAACAPLTLHADEPLHCDVYSISGTTAQQTPTSPFVGELTFVNLVTNAQRQVRTSTLLLGVLEIETDGTQRAVTSHDMSSVDGGGNIAFTTFDDASLIPTDVPGLLALASRVRITDGHGSYNCGEVVFAEPSTVDFRSGSGIATLQGLAKLCRCSP